MKFWIKGLFRGHTAPATWESGSSSRESSQEATVGLGFADLRL